MPIKEDFPTGYKLNYKVLKKNKLIILLTPMLLFLALTIQHSQNTSLVYALLFGFPAGIFIAITEAHLAEYRLVYKRLSFLYLSLNITAKFTAVLIALFSLVYVFGRLVLPQFFVSSWVDFFLNEMIFLALFTLGLSFVNHFYSWLVKKLGKNVLWSILTGRYHKPTKEERIFLFIDLKDSTYYAESLDDFQYSALLQDFFYDIGETVEKYHGSIYQYVGDEVVITWTSKKGLEAQNCLNCYSSIRTDIQKSSKTYIERYGFVPSFKAAMHIGEVIVSEVGKYKVEIAFHGDALNTTSRIADLCRRLNQEFLVSGALLKSFSEQNTYQFSSLGFHKMRGKSNAVEVFSTDFIIFLKKEELETLNTQ